MLITSFLHENKSFSDIFFGGRGRLLFDFCETLTVLYQISLKSLVYLTDFSPQLMACMHTCMFLNIFFSEITGLFELIFIFL